jgi:hypothetical protein
MKFKMQHIIASLILLVAIQAQAVEYFIHPEGGDIEHCNGLSSQPFSQDIVNQECALKHIFELLGPEHKTIAIEGGDIITLLNNQDGSQAEYRMGHHDDYTSGACSTSWAYDCNLPSLPAGTVNNPTIIRGEDWNNNCAIPPHLWGSNRASKIFSLINTQHVELSCLEITDHSSCVGAHGFPDASLVCDRSTPYTKLFADTGIYMENSSDITLTDVMVKGLSTGIHAGRVRDITLLRTQLYANSSAGWNGDIYGDDDSVSGTIYFKDSAITFSGCGLIYNPDALDHGQPHACARQAVGGYGDGIGTGETGGTWIFDNTQILYNNSDGIDLLYHHGEGDIIIKNSRIEGNGGNQVKVTGNTQLINNVIISNCGWNSRQAASLGAEGTNCRAGGAAISISWSHPDDKAILLNNTVLSEGDCIMGTGDRTDIGAQNQGLYIVNNIFYGVTDFRQEWENSCLLYRSATHPYKQIHNNILHQVKGYESPCENFATNIPSGHNANAGPCSIASGGFFDDVDYSIATNPHFLKTAIDIQHTAYDLTTLKAETNKPYPQDSGSPVYNAGYSGNVAGVSIPTKDFLGNAREGLPDIGAVEFIEGLAPLPTPTPSPNQIPKAPVIISIEQLD